MFRPSRSFRGQQPTGIQAYQEGIDSGLVRAKVEKRWPNLGQTQSRTSPSLLEYTKRRLGRALGSCQSRVKGNYETLVANGDPLNLINK